MVSETIRVLQHLLQLGHLLVPAVVAHLLDHRPNYRRHSALGWQTPASRYAGRAMD
jgi:transposase InsO family protein